LEGEGEVVVVVVGFEEEREEDGSREERVPVAVMDLRF